MPHLNLDESLEQSSLGIDYSASIDDRGMAESWEIQEIDPDRPVLTEIPGRVLLVEPAAHEQSWLRNELLAGRMEVSEATDLITARAVAMFQPNLILAQLRLPTYSGLELVRRLKRDSTTQSIPVLLYTDLATAEERIQALELGASDLISKPFVAAEVLARLRGPAHPAPLDDPGAGAHLDSLTGLANRGVLDDRLPREWEACRRRRTALAVMIADLDHFKAVNDNHGHAAGDTVLRQSAATLARVIRTSDFVARYGGEEFVVVAPDCEISAAVRLAERFRTAIEQLRIDEHGDTIPVTTSVGVASFADLTRTGPAELLRRADEALYRAKEAGRNATWFWEQTQSSPAPAAPSSDTEP